jgi:hypothetical protein
MYLLPTSNIEMLTPCCVNQTATRLPVTGWQPKVECQALWLMYEIQSRDSYPP